MGRPYKGVLDTVRRILEEGTLLTEQQAIINQSNSLTSVVSSNITNSVSVSSSQSLSSDTPLLSSIKTKPSNNTNTIDIGIKSPTTITRGFFLSIKRYRVFFSGIEPRVMWISIGGFVFFGAYEQAKIMFSYVL